MRLIEKFTGCKKPEPITSWGQLKPGDCAEHVAGSVWMRVAVGCHRERLGVIGDSEISCVSSRQVAMVPLTDHQGYPAGHAALFDCSAAAFKRPLPNVGLVKDTEA